ncbi:reverse transcriptase domain-containing protein [Tanacetum coccineum]
MEEVKARLDFGDNRKKSARAQESAYSESRTISSRRQRRSRSPRHNHSVFTRLRRERSRSPRHEYKSKERRESIVFKRLGGRGWSTSVHSDSRQESSRYTENYSESEDSEGGHWKSKSRRKKFSVENDDLSQPWVCAETDPFTSQIHHFDFSKTRMPSHVKTYNGSEDPEDHLKIFQAAAKTERWAMPTWCHMFNSTLTGNARVWFDDLPPESIDSYNDLREAFLKNYLQQKKCIRDPIVLHNIKQRDGESTEDFIQRYKSESGNVKGAPECMRISGFVHGITNPELIKRFHEKIPKTVDEMMQVATSFLQGQEAASNQERKKAPQAWRHQEGGHRQNFKKGGGFRSQHKMEKRPDRFTLLTKTPKEIMALEKGEFKTPPPMTTPVEKRNANKFCEFHGEVGHNTDECNHLRKQIKDMLKAGKLSHIIREMKQNSEKEQPKKKGETSEKEKPQAILMIQSRQNAVRQIIIQSFSPDLEISFPSLGNEEGAEGPLIIEAEIGGHQVHRMCIDGGSSFEILYEHCFNLLRPEIRNQMVPATTSLVGFSGEIKWPLGQITLLVKVGDDEHSTSAWMDFMVVRSTSPFNGIIGRPGLRKMKVVPSTTHGMIKFPVMGGTLTLRSSKIIPIECTMVSGPEDQPPPMNKVKEERIKVAINPEQTVMIGSDLTEKTRSKLCNLLQRSLDIFAWTSTDMTGVPRQIAEHKLNVRKGCPPVRQKKIGQAAERNIAINDEVSKLVTAGIMREVHYHDWLSNPVMVKKSDNSWRMCVDFKDLNKACPKDGYPLPKIDWKFESLCGFPFKCFMDAYKGYHQIQMAEEDEEKTAFITNQGIFCYTKMPFGLRNVGATYQRLVDKTFHGQIGRNLEVYVDDLVIKSRTEDEVVRDIEETFKTLRKINMKLNPKKCTFGVEEGMFLGYQKLNGKLASLNSCIQANEGTYSKVTYAHRSRRTRGTHCLPSSVRGSGERHTHDGKGGPADANLLCKPGAKGPEINYTAMEKLVLALIHASKRLRRYFQAHPITVITDQPIKNVLSNPEAAGRMQKWSIQLGEFGIHYMPRVSVKGQVLANFIVERPEEERKDDSARKEEPLPARWTLFTDGSSCVDGCRAGVILTDPEGVEFTYALRFQFETTNNEAEYEALIVGLRIAEKMGVKNLEVNVDSKLVANQVNGTYIAKETDMVKYLEKVKALTNTFHAFSIKQVPRSKNKKARAIKRKSQRFAIINGILYKKSFLGLWLRYVGPSQANYVLREIHEGSYSMHAGTRSVVAKALRTGYYWPTMHKDARALIKACQECQVHKPVPRNPQEKLNPITSLWPFYKWGIDIAGPFPEGPGKTNGLVERENWSLGEGIKARLGKENKNWLEEISHELWAHRTMIKSGNGDTPFSLTYGTEAVIPAEIGMPTFRIAEADVAENDKALEINLDLIEEKREQAAIREAKSKRQMEKYYNTKVRDTSFKPGDLVYRSNEVSRVEDTRKLGPKWEGPYEVTEVLGKGSYKLKDRDGRELPRTWNVCNLKKCYIHKM